jgi:hypothetical protein
MLSLLSALFFLLDGEVLIIRNKLPDGGRILIVSKVGPLSNAASSRQRRHDRVDCADGVCIVGGGISDALLHGPLCKR